MYTRSDICSKYDNHVWVNLHVSFVRPCSCSQVLLVLMVFMVYLYPRSRSLTSVVAYFQAWNVYGVLNYLQAFVEKSSIIHILEEEKEGLEQFTLTDGYDYSGGSSNVLKVLGYFSMVGLLRVHCLLGDYHTGLKCLLPIDITQQGVFTSVIGSHITTIYHYGFANLMLRRYYVVWSPLDSFSLVWCSLSR